ncbi:hypothetical protein HAX54_053043 [Datura stramonium]|uniref:Uncharacterized protein n=1 Tax=Datura stramonium TaxID=4076 RepID=A0ABS8T0U9_DATST|nr:hypothetical protein [Datura stramonium]
MVSTLVTESAKSRERLDIATENVSILLSRIREQPICSQAPFFPATVILRYLRSSPIRFCTQREDNASTFDST